MVFSVFKNCVSTSAHAVIRLFFGKPLAARVGATTMVLIKKLVKTRVGLSTVPASGDPPPIFSSPQAPVKRSFFQYRIFYVFTPAFEAKGAHQHFG